MSYFRNRESVVAFVSDTILNSKAGLPWTMIIGQDKSGDYYAHTVIVESSDDTDLIRATISYEEPMNTSSLNTQDGLFPTNRSVKDGSVD